MLTPVDESDTVVISNDDDDLRIDQQTLTASCQSSSQESL